jgi:copper(I)-binding protein
MTHHLPTRRLALALAALCLSLPALAQTPSPSPVQVDGAWVRTSVAGQSGTGAFMRLTAREPLTLVGAQTPVAGVAEVHEMKMDGDVMRMRALAAGLELPAGKAVELKPGGYHLMLMNLKAPLRPDTRVPLTLVLRDAKGTERRVELQLPVAVRAPGAAPAAEAGGHMHGPAHKH